MRSLPKFQHGLKFAWRKIQAEVFRYWEDMEIRTDKTILNEDARLMIGAYALAQSLGGCKDFVAMLYAV